MLLWFEKHNKISWLVTIGIAVFIFYLSSKPFSGALGGISLSVMYHFWIFFLLTFFLLISLVRGKIKISLIIVGIIFSNIYSIFDEVHQYFVPGRFLTISDILTNAAGIFFAGFVYLIRCSKNIGEFKKEKVIF